MKDQYAMYTEALIIDTEDVYNYNGDSIFSKIDKIAFLFIFSVFLGGFRGASFGISRSQNELQILLLSLLQYLPLNILLETSVSSGSETIRKINKKVFRYSLSWVEIPKLWKVVIGEVNLKRITLPEVCGIFMKLHVRCMTILLI